MTPAVALRQIAGIRPPVPTGAVIIGRNEGERLRACLTSVIGRVDRLVYVDSGSTDQSLKIARDLGVDTLALETALPFTAARARNAGFRHLRQSFPQMALVQFIDGDCELHPHWMEAATAVIHRAPDAAIICGRRRERAPSASVYNRLCDVEWDTPAGETDSCGGDFLARADAIASAGGFTDELIAGEEPELCQRLRSAGWTIYRIAREMTVHDAAIYRFSQWWQRNRRSGHASAEALYRRGSGQLRLWRTVLSNFFWAIPVAWPIWPLMWWRIARRGGGLYAAFILLGKIPHCHGQILYFYTVINSPRQTVIIEYK